MRSQAVNVDQLLRSTAVRAELDWPLCCSPPGRCLAWRAGACSRAASGDKARHPGAVCLLQGKEEKAQRPVMRFAYFQRFACLISSLTSVIPTRSSGKVCSHSHSPPCAWREGRGNRREEPLVGAPSFSRACCWEPCSAGASVRPLLRAEPFLLGLELASSRAGSGWSWEPGSSGTVDAWGWL